MNVAVQSEFRSVSVSRRRRCAEDTPQSNDGGGDSGEGKGRHLYGWTIIVWNHDGRDDKAERALSAGRLTGVMGGSSAGTGPEE